MTSTSSCLYMNTDNSGEWGSRSQIHVIALMAATALGLYLCYLMALPFVSALTWALALAVLFMPVHRWLESTLKHPNLAASVSVLVIGLIVVVPATFMGQRLVSEAVTGADTIRARVESGEWQRALDDYPRFAAIAQQIEGQIDLPGTISTIAAWLTNAIASFVRGSVIQVIGVLLTFYLLFYFLRDRRAVLLSLRSVSPLSEADMDRVFSHVGATVHATIYGTLAVASSPHVSAVHEAYRAEAAGACADRCPRDARRPGSMGVFAPTSGNSPPGRAHGPSLPRPRPGRVYRGSMGAHPGR